MFTILEIATCVAGSLEHEPGESREAFVVRDLVHRRDRAALELKGALKQLDVEKAAAAKLRADVAKKDEALNLALRYIGLAKKAGFSAQMEIAGTGGFGMLAAGLRGGGLDVVRR